MPGSGVSWPRRRVVTTCMARPDNEARTVRTCIAWRLRTIIMNMANAESVRANGVNTARDPVTYTKYRRPSSQAAAAQASYAGRQGIS